jgi:hypothetical protein
MRPTVYLAAGTALLLTVAAYREPGASARTDRQYGPSQQLGDGTVRTYITRDPRNDDVPLEVGVAISERAMESLPMTAPMSMDHSMPGASSKAAPMPMSVFLLDLPDKNPTPYRFVQFDWNPQGHEPAGVYDLPHFDFHFYTVSRDVRSSILPSDPQYAAKAAAMPDSIYRAPFYIDAATAAKAPAEAAAVPEMGMHWLDVRAPELQGLAGHPENAKVFAKTFLYGSWDGVFIFDEPMITRAYLRAKRDAKDPSVRDEIIPLSAPSRRSPGGYYPKAYRITYDGKAREYRVALTQLAFRN